MSPGVVPKGPTGALSMREPHNKHRCNGDICGFYSASGTSSFILIFTKFEHCPHFTDDETEP